MVPFLVLLPLVESTDMEAQSTMALLQALGPTALKTLGGLGLLLLGGRFILRRIFEIVAQARSDETFVALCLLTVTGASLCTQRLGFSSTLGAFVAGVLLAETNYRTQVEVNVCSMCDPRCSRYKCRLHQAKLTCYNFWPCIHLPVLVVTSRSTQMTQTPLPVLHRQTSVHSAACCWACSL